MTLMATEVQASESDVQIYECDRVKYSPFCDQVIFASICFVFINLSVASSSGDYLVHTTTPAGTYTLQKPVTELSSLPALIL